MGRGKRITTNPINKRARTEDNKSSNKELADEIEKIQTRINNGRGISAAQTIVAFLRANKRDKASACLQNEYDKFESYPELKEALEPLRNFELIESLKIKD